MKKIIALGFLCLSVWTGAAQAQLKVDFTVTNGPVETGYEGYFATRNQPATFTAQSYSAFGTTVTIQPTWALGAANTAHVTINRTGSSTNRYTGDHANLVNTWIGTDARQTGGNSMTLTISGLPAGTYSWLSYHHDPDNQTGQFEVTVNDAAGAPTIAVVDISDSRLSGVVAFADVTRFRATIVSDGTSDVTLVFRQISSASSTELAFFVMNGFELMDQATKPVPGPQDPPVSRDDTILSWTANPGAVAHDVYLGTEYDAIDDATTASAVYMGRQDTSSFEAGRLQLGAIYYWRVDEIFSGGRISKGNIWSFRVEPLSVPLDGGRIKATASSSNSIDEGPGKTVDGSGLDPNDHHSTVTTDMWLSGADVNTAWIQFELDKAYRLHQMQVWNHNSSLESSIGLGVKEATIEYSTDGSAWTTLGATPVMDKAPGVPSYTGNAPLDLGGIAAKYVRIRAVSNWSGVLKQFGLSEVRFLVIPVRAGEPQPAAGATGVDPGSVLSWRAGREAGRHEVYLSTDVNEVVNGTALARTVAEPRLDAGSSLALGRTYHWKVNEVNDVEDPSVWEGEVWSFSTTAYLSVDDMESYNDEEDQGTRIYEVWLDGWDDPANGSQVGHADPPFAELTTVHGGTHSMPFYYDNSTVSSSEATRTFDSPQDWTGYGAKALTLWFYGDPTNTAAQMYVKINGHKVVYGGDADNLLRKPWQLWYLDLGGVTGVNLKKVTELTLGFEGGTGRVFFDDIALSGSDRRLVTPAQPDATNLLVHCPMEGSANSSVGTLTPTVGGAPTFVPGKVGQALKLNGATDYVTYEGSLDLPVYSAALWFRVEGGTAERDLISIYNAGGAHGILLEVRGNGGLRFLHRFPVGVSSGDVDIYSNGKYDDGAWYHAAIVKTAEAMTLYVNGVAAGTKATTTQFDQALPRFTLGILAHTGSSRRFPGEIDEVYLYNRVLSPAEIAWLAGRTAPFDQP